jgi:hypothetical protein
MESFLVKVAGLSNPQCVWILVRNTEYQFCFKVFGQFHMYHEKLSTFCGLCRRTTKWPSRKAPKIVGGWVVMTIIAILAKGINDPCCCYHYHYQQISTVCSFCAMSSWLYTVFWRIIFVVIIIVINYNYIYIYIYIVFITNGIYCFYSLDMTILFFVVYYDNGNNNNYYYNYNNNNSYYYYYFFFS